MLADHSLRKKEKKVREKEDSRYIYQNELDKACFQYDIAYEDTRDLNRRTAADKVLHYKALDIAKNPKYDGYQHGLVSMVYKSFDKKTSGGTVKNENKLAKPVIRKFNKRKAHSPFIDNIWDVDLADMQLISKFNKVFWFLLCVIDLYSKYTWVIPLKDKKGIASTNAFQKILSQNLRWI